MKKIKIKESCPRGSISNRFFTIDKWQIVTVDDKFNVDKSVFDIVEIDGNPVKKKDKLNESEITKLLDIDVGRLQKERIKLKQEQEKDIGKFDSTAGDKVKIIAEKPVTVDETEEFRKRLQEEDIGYNGIQQLLEAEKRGKNRKGIVSLLEDIPAPQETDINITEQTQFMNDLRSVPQGTDRAVRLIVKKFQNKDELIKALQDDDKFFKIEEYRNDFTPQFIERLKKHYGMIKSVTTTSDTLKKSIRGRR